MLKAGELSEKKIDRHTLWTLARAGQVTPAGLN